MGVRGHHGVGAGGPPSLRAITWPMAAGYHIAAVETSPQAVNLYDWAPVWPLCLVFGHETEGVSPDVARLSSDARPIPMLGRKHSLNVATAGRSGLYECCGGTANSRPLSTGT